MKKLPAFDFHAETLAVKRLLIKKEGVLVKRIHGILRKANIEAIQQAKSIFVQPEIPMAALAPAFRKIEKEISDAKSGIGIYLKSEMETELKDSAYLSAKMLQHNSSTFKKITGVTLHIKSEIPSAVVSSLWATPFKGAKVEERIVRATDDLEFQVRSIMTRGVMEGLSYREVAGELKTKFGAAYNNFDTLAHTEIHRASNVAAMSIYQVNADAGVLKGIRRMGTLDSKTCKICGPMDGAIYFYEKAESKFKKGYDHVMGIPAEDAPVLPAHPHCRCTYVPITYTYKDLGYDVEESAAMRPMKDYQKGLVKPKVMQVEADTRWESWFKTQPREIHEKVLGKANTVDFMAGNLFMKGGKFIHKRA